MNQTTTAGIDLDATAKLDQLLTRWSEAAESGVTSHEEIRDLIVAHILARRAEPSVAADERAIKDAIRAAYDDGYGHGKYDGVTDSGCSRYVGRKVEDERGQKLIAALASPAVSQMDGAAICQPPSPTCQPTTAMCQPEVSANGHDAAWQSGYRTGYETGLSDGRAEFTNPVATSPAERAAIASSAAQEAK
jgi:hypothetical protein